MPYAERQPARPRSLLRVECGSSPSSPIRHGWAGKPPVAPGRTLLAAPASASNCHSPVSARPAWRRFCFPHGLGCPHVRALLCSLETQSSPAEICHLHSDHSDPTLGILSDRFAFGWFIVAVFSCVLEGAAGGERNFQWLWIAVASGAPTARLSCREGVSVGQSVSQPASRIWANLKPHLL